jgi:hypothetical protein
MTEQGQYVFRGDLVVNVVVKDPTGVWQPPEGCWVIDIPEGSFAGIGWRYVDGEWIAPPPMPEPEPDEELEP